MKIFWGMTKNLLNKNSIAEEIHIFGESYAKEDSAFLRAVSYNRKGVSGILSSIKTRYLAKVQKEIQENPIVPHQYNKIIQIPKSTHNPKLIKNTHKTILRMNSVWEKHNYMQKVFSLREQEFSKNSDNFLNLNLTKGEQNHSPIKIKRKKSISRDDTTTVVAFNANDLVVQPKYMENRGSMCLCELWNEKDRQRVAKKYENKIIDAIRLPVGEMGKAYIGIYKPQKIATERVTVQMLTENKNGMDVAYTDRIRAEARTQRTKKKIKKSNSTSNILKKDFINSSQDNNLQRSMSMLKLPNTNIKSIDNDRQNDDKKENSPLVKNLSTLVMSTSRALFLQRIKLLGRKEEHDQTPINDSPFLIKNELSTINKTGNEAITDPTYLNPLQEGEIPIQTEEMLIQDLKRPEETEIKGYESLPVNSDWQNNEVTSINYFSKTKRVESPKIPRKKDKKRFPSVSFSGNEDKERIRVKKYVKSLSKELNLNQNK